jgi:hypothetical protein
MRDERLAALGRLAADVTFPVADPRFINNHIHTTYSFSPYSPAAAAFSARYCGLCTAGIMDHDSMGGAREFIAAGDALGLPTTVGLECRARMDGTPLEVRRTNNPDQAGVSYMTLHAVPHDNIEAVQAYFAPRRALRNERNAVMTARVNDLVKDLGLTLNFGTDVLPLSRYSDGGSVTERHLMYALALKMIERGGRGEPLVALLAEAGVILSGEQRALLENAAGSFYDYDLLGILKSAFLPRAYIPATDECPLLSEIVDFAAGVGAILCYAYLGDVARSPTGDKAAQKFEDDYLDELFEVLKQSGVRAVTYMPPRNTNAQLGRLRALCERYGMYQISGEDINSPRQDFVCQAMKDPQFANLIDAAWALIAHERGEKKILLHDYPTKA